MLEIISKFIVKWCTKCGAKFDVNFIIEDKINEVKYCPACGYSPLLEIDLMEGKIK
jgi:DNA-directed RNA polymerase subunit RPC12/RpoP